MPIAHNTTSTNTMPCENFMVFCNASLLPKIPSFAMFKPLCGCSCPILIIYMDWINLKSIDTTEMLYPIQ